MLLCPISTPSKELAGIPSLFQRKAIGGSPSSAMQVSPMLLPDRKCKVLVKRLSLGPTEKEKHFEDNTLRNSGILSAV